MPPPQQQQGNECAPGFQCTPRLTFWVIAASSWLVWIFAVSAAADDKWIKDNGQGDWLAAGEDPVLNLCDGLDDAADDDLLATDEYKDFVSICDLYRAFTAMQMLATIVCSVSVLLLALAFFRPEAGKCASTRTLAFVGGALMATYALFQLVAVVLAAVLAQEFDNLPNDDDTSYLSGYDGFYTFFEAGYEAEVGPTFGVGVTALILAVIMTVVLCLCATRTGDGPLYKCCHSLMLANKSNGIPSSGGEGGVGGGGGKGVPVVADLPASVAAARPGATEQPSQQQHYQQAQPQRQPPPPYGILPSAEV
ncbi:unnamed protein product [Ectocarpus sp. CCAP 1310/34]|nr:unnamed protein product [Ectocarpus sp. CCAP 1310/34]